MQPLYGREVLRINFICEKQNEKEKKVIQSLLKKKEREFDLRLDEKDKKVVELDEIIKDLRTQLVSAIAEK